MGRGVRVLFWPHKLDTCVFSLFLSFFLSLSFSLSLFLLARGNSGPIGAVHCTRVFDAKRLAASTLCLLCLLFVWLVWFCLVLFGLLLLTLVRVCVFVCVYFSLCACLYFQSFMTGKPASGPNALQPDANEPDFCCCC